LIKKPLPNVDKKEEGHPEGEGYPILKRDTTKERTPYPKINILIFDEILEFHSLQKTN